MHAVIPGYNDHPRDQNIVAVVDRWSYFRRHLCFKMPNWDLKIVRYPKVVVSSGLTVLLIWLASLAHYLISRIVGRKWRECRIVWRIVIWKLRSCKSEWVLDEDRHLETTTTTTVAIATTITPTRNRNSDSDWVVAFDAAKKMVSSRICIKNWEILKTLSKLFARPTKKHQKIFCPNQKI